MNLNPSSHCIICENQLYNFQSGTYCALNNKKPNFQGKCIKIKFGDFLKKETEKVNLDYELIKRTKTIAYFNFVLFSVLSLILLIGGYTFGKFIYDKGVIATLPLIIMGSGIPAITKAFSSLNAYNRDIKITEYNKEKHDALLAKYGIKYTFNFNVTQFYNIEEITTNIKFSGIRI
jgi:hypothetical protein